MASREKGTPPAADPRPGRNPGYAEDEPRDRKDVRDPHAKEPPSPDDGGVDRETDDAQPTDD
jgi:hypothetical protein